MAGGKETPRQKMIGMMYLVLTALLAMNVSKEVLNAFVVVNDGLQRTNENFEKKNEKTLIDFKAALDKDKAKTQPYYDRAQNTKKLCSSLITYIDDIKKNLIMVTDKKEKSVADTLKLALVDSKDNYDEPTRLLIGDEPSKPIEGDLTASALKKRIADLRVGLLQLFHDEKLFLPGTKKQMEAKLGLETPDFGVVNGVKESWETGNFYHLPLAAVITNLSKMQNDVHNAEADVLNTLYAAVKGKDVTFDKLTAKVIAPSSYILAGDDYKADVLLVAYNSTSNPKIFVGDVDTTIKDEMKNMLIGTGEEIKDISSGAGHYIKPTAGEGLQKWSGVIEVDAPEGKKYYPFSAEYIVAKPAAAVSPDKMNVFYIGVDNPVSVTAAGVAPEQLSVTMSGGTISGSKGKYIVRVTNSGTATVMVGAKFGAASKPMGKFDFRIKTVPNPIALINGKRDGELLSKSELSSVGVITAKLENFDFDLPATVTGFEMTTLLKGQLVNYVSNSNQLSAEMKGVLKNLNPGAKIFFENIKASVAGSSRKLGSLNLKVK